MTDEVQAQLQRDVGRLEGKVDAMARQNKDMGDKLDKVVGYIDQQKGATRATKLIGAAISTVVGGAAALAVSWLHK